MPTQKKTVVCVLCDEQSYADLNGKIDEWSKCEHTTFVMTQSVAFAEKFADRIMVIDNDKLILDASQEELKVKAAREQVYELQLQEDNSEVANKIYVIDGVLDVHVSGEMLYVTCVNGIDNLDSIISLLLSENVKIKRTHSMPNDLETVIKMLKLKK